jgi:hypothetical protein
MISERITGRVATKLAFQGWRRIMSILKKITLGVATVSAAVMPIAASAAPVADLRAVSVVDEASEVEGTSWVLILFAVAAVVGGIVAIAGGSDNSPTSP